MEQVRMEQVRMEQARPTYGGGGKGGDIQYRGGPVSAQPRETIQQALDEHESHINELHGGLNALADRLSLVLGPASPATESSAPQPTSPNVIERLRQQTRGLRAAEAKIADLIQRLQV